MAREMKRASVTGLAVRDRLEGFMEEHLQGLLDAVGHDDGGHSATRGIYCSDHQIEDHPHLEDYMPELALIIHTGVDSKGEGPISLSDNLTFEHVQRTAFTNLRKIFGVNESEYIKQLENMNGGGTEPSGKSGSLFWFSDDKSMVLKSITELEVAKIEEILEDYTAHYQEAKKAGRLVLLCQFYGVYRICVGDSSVALLCMNNVFGQRMPTRVYDIKGTTEDRYVDPGPGKVMKDLNYENLQVCLGSAQAEQIQGACERDSAFLERNNIMDYSLLLGVYDKPNTGSDGKGGSPVYKGTELEDGELSVERNFQMGIIDMLVDYSGKKIAAHWLKKFTIGMCSEIDTEPPSYYQRRFSECASQKIVPAGTAQ